jgi:uncharacterized repeat protein (TIGR04076 family)
MEFDDWGEIGRILSYMIPVIIFLLVNVFFKKQQEQKRRLTVVRSLLSDIDYNQNLIEASSYQRKMNKFKTKTWKSNKGKMNYIAPDLYSNLSDAFGIAEELNREIDAAKKHRLASYMATLQTDRLRKPLDRCKQELEAWLMVNKDKKKADWRALPVCPDEILILTKEESGMFKVRCKFVSFLADAERFPCHFNYKEGDEFYYDGVHFTGRICPGLLASMMPVIWATHLMGNRCYENVMYRYRGLDAHDPSMAKYDGVGFRPWSPETLPEDAPQAMVKTVASTPKTERAKGGWHFECGDFRTLAHFSCEAVDLSDSDYCQPFYRRAIAILEKK